MPMLHIIPFLGCLRLSVAFVSIDLHSEKPCFSVQFVDRYYVKLGVDELGVGEWSEVRSGGVESGGVMSF